MSSTPRPSRPSHQDPLFILAMDHRDSFGHILFGVSHDDPTPEQTERMRVAKSLVYAGLRRAVEQLRFGHAGVLVDEQYGQAVIDRAPADGLALAVPIEASGHEWFTTEWGEVWLSHIRHIGPTYAKVLVRDNPALPELERRRQLELLAEVSVGLRQAGVPLLYELLVPATDQQLAAVGGDPDRYDRELRPELVVRVIADNQAVGVEPRLWKVEGLETTEAAQAVADAARTGGRDVDLIVLGRDAPAEKLDHWLTVACGVSEFVGFAIGRSIWADVLGDWARHTIDDETAEQRVADRYLGFTRQWTV